MSSNTREQREQYSSKKKCCTLETSTKYPTAIMVLHWEQLLNLQGWLQVNKVYFARYEETTVSIYWKHGTSVACLCIINHTRENLPDRKVTVVTLSQDSKSLQLWLQFLAVFANLTFCRWFFRPKKLLHLLFKDRICTTHVKKKKKQNNSPKILISCSPKLKDYQHHLHTIINT